MTVNTVVMVVNVRMIMRTVTSHAGFVKSESGRACNTLESLRVPDSRKVASDTISSSIDILKARGTNTCVCFDIMNLVGGTSFTCLCCRVKESGRFTGTVSGSVVEGKIIRADTFG